MKKKGIILCVVLGVALLVGGGAYVYANSQPAPAIAVKTAPLSKATLQNTISATGVIESYNKVKINDTSRVTDPTNMAITPIISITLTHRQNISRNESHGQIRITI